MKSAERIISLIWIAFAIWACAISARIKLGSLSEPGPGFLPFWTGTLIGLMAFIHLLQTMIRRDQRELPGVTWHNVNWKKAGSIVISLALYTILLPWLGYITDTFFLMLFLFGIMERQSWWVVLGYDGAVIGISYLVFKIWLGVQFPTGVLGIG